jgi:hypothetical protein
MLVTTLEKTLEGCTAAAIQNSDVAVTEFLRDRHTVEPVFRQPVARNLTWMDVLHVLKLVGAAAEQGPDGKYTLQVNGKHLVLQLQRNIAIRVSFGWNKPTPIDTPSNISVFFIGLTASRSTSFQIVRLVIERHERAAARKLARLLVHALHRNLPICKWLNSQTILKRTSARSRSQGLVIFGDATVKRTVMRHHTTANEEASSAAPAARRSAPRPVVETPKSKTHCGVWSLASVGWERNSPRVMTVAGR